MVSDGHAFSDCYRRRVTGLFESLVSQGGAGQLALLVLVITMASACAAGLLGIPDRWGKEAGFSDIDSLTGFPNRTAFDAELSRRVAAARFNEKLAVIAMEIAGLDAIYQQFGTRIGAMVVEAIARRLQEARAPGVFLARIGGAQFCGVGTVFSREDMHQRAERLRAALSANLLIEARELTIDVRVSAAILPGDAQDAQGLMRRALAALARAVSDPLGAVALHDEAADALAQRRLTLASDLRGALGRKEFCLFYQPQVWIADGSIIAYEALLRWHHPEFGMVSPAEFIPLAEQAGSIIAIGEWVLREACAEASRWPDTVRVAVNLSPLQLRQATLPECVKQALLASGLAPDRLEIELTESLLIEDRAHALEIFAQIKTLGVRMVLDDFGTGYSSMAMLRRFPFDKVKLDKSFVADIETDLPARAILHATLVLGRKLGLPVLVEGVETERQLDILHEEGCTKVQGYLTGRPAPAVLAFNTPVAKMVA